MTVLTMGPADEGFIISEANGFRSRGVRTLKSGSVYEPGSVVVAEHEDDSGSYVPTGKHVLATASDIETWGAVDLDAAIVLRRTDATGGAAEASVIDCDAEVNSDELTVGEDTDLDDVAAALAAKGIKVREAI